VIFLFSTIICVQDKLNDTSDVVILIISCEKMRFIAIEADGGHWRAERLKESSPHRSDRKWKESLFSGAVGTRREIPCYCIL
jgi:hypothetical protein